jgi:hypothetical protein
MRCHAGSTTFLVLLSFTLLVVVCLTPLAHAQSQTNVATAAELQSAVSKLTSNQVLILADGTYNLNAPLYLPQNVSNVTIKGASGNRAAVIVKGNGMSGTVLFGFWADNVNGVTFANMTIRDFSQHGIILNGGVNKPAFRNLHIIDIGDQLIKANPSPNGLNGVDNGILEHSVLEYTTSAPDSYTNGLDVHRGRNWIVRNNIFRNFWSSGLTGPAVLVWNGSSDTTVNGNTFINNQRDIFLGLDPNKPADSSPDHARGLVANNFIYKTASIKPDAAIGVFDSPQTRIYHNTVLMNGGYPNAIEYRFSGTTGVEIRNNLSDARIVSRDSASASVSSNVTNANPSIFVNPALGDLHLRADALMAIDKGEVVDVSDDIDGQSRRAGNAPDVGADEYFSVASSPAAPSNLIVR